VLVIAGFGRERHGHAIVELLCGSPPQFGKFKESLTRDVVPRVLRGLKALVGIATEVVLRGYGAILALQAGARLVSQPPDAWTRGLSR
jgi:hypothetical protein